jgi:ABC-type sugar transport system ATPase subunit
VGAGRSELAQAIFGLDPVRQGTISIRGKPVRVDAPAAAIALGIGLVPEDRKRQGLVPQASALHNVSLAILRRLASFGWLRRAEERAVATELFGRLRVRASAMDAVVAGLSGGNQQKIVLARWLAARSRVLILDEPTRGVDVGAKAEIHSLIGELAAQGTAILLISSELPEVLTLSHRILVLREGRIVGEVVQAQATQDGLLRMMAGLGRPARTGHAQSDSHIAR